MLEDVIEGVNNLSLDFKTIKPKKGQEILELKKELISHLMQLKLLILEYKKIEKIMFNIVDFSRLVWNVVTALLIIFFIIFCD